MIRTDVLTALLVSIAACGCTSAIGSQGTALRPSQLNAHPERYDGRMVAVRGFLIIKPESHVLYESRALSDEYARRWRSEDPSFDPKDYNKYCLTIANPQFFDRIKRQVAGSVFTVRGKFLATYRGPRDIDIGSCALPTGILVDEFLL